MNLFFCAGIWFVGFLGGMFVMSAKHRLED